MISAKKPMTTEGKPASNSMAGLIISRIQVGANAAENSAARMARGPANKIAIIVILNVPAINGSNPYLGRSDTGIQTFPASPFNVTLWPPPDSLTLYNGTAASPETALSSDIISVAQYPSCFVSDCAETFPPYTS